MPTSFQWCAGPFFLVPAWLLAAWLWPAGLKAATEAPVELREGLAVGTSTQVRIELKADGLFRPGLPPASVTAEAKMPKPLVLDVKSRLVFSERVLKADLGAASSLRPGEAASEKKGGPGRAVKVARWVAQAASAINGEVRATAGLLRPERSLLVVERKRAEETVVVVSPAGPMTRAELEQVQGPADPLLLADLLPRGPVAKGQSWKLPNSAVFALSDYDTLESSTLEAKLERLDETSARLRLSGEVQGSARGGGGKITCEGFASFDRKAGLVDRLELNRTETRQAGPVEAGLDVKSTLSVVRRPGRLAPELADAAIGDLPLDTSPQRQLLQLIAPDGKYSLLHDRRWHTFWDDPKLVVLKRLDKGRVIAHCNLATGPRAGRGKHQDLEQFRDDVRRALGQRFVQFQGAGEVDGNPAGGFRYKVGVQGREGDLGVLWYYYLIASPDGDQLLATFTLAEQDLEAFGEQDLAIIRSLEWTLPAGKKP
jgi:hypothetical protein